MAIPCTAHPAVQGLREGYEPEFVLGESPLGSQIVAAKENAKDAVETAIPVGKPVQYPVFELEALENVVVLCWKQVPTVDGVEELEHAFTQILHDYDRLALLTILEDEPARGGAPESVRTGVASLLNRYAQQIAGAAIVYDGGGFRSAIVRSVITAINILSRAKFRNQVFGDVQAASHWLLDHLGNPNVSVEEVTSLVIRVRA